MTTDGKSSAWDIISWILAFIFFMLGILNMIYVHIVPGIIYVLISLLYIPATNAFLKKSLGFSIPMAVKIILAILILWFTLGVGELMELFESKVL